MENKPVMTCIICPMGCRLELTVKDGAVVGVEGNGCARGPKYAAAEFVAPRRTLTTTVRLTGAANGDKLLPVRTREPIPKGKLFEAMAETAKLTAKAPIRRGDVLTADFIEAGNALIACKTVD